MLFNCPKCYHKFVIDDKAKIVQCVNCGTTFNLESIQNKPNAPINPKNIYRPKRSKNKGAFYLFLGVLILCGAVVAYILLSDSEGEPTGDTNVVASDSIREEQPAKEQLADQQRVQDSLQNVVDSLARVVEKDREVKQEETEEKTENETSTVTQKPQEQKQEQAQKPAAPVTAPAAPTNKTVQKPAAPVAKPAAPSNNTVQKPAAPVRSSGSNDLGYATFVGAWPNEVNGRMVFKSSHQIDSRDPKGRIAEPGDYVIGEWSEGHLVQGIWYGSDNVVKGSILIGK